MRLLATYWHLTEMWYGFWNPDAFSMPLPQVTRMRGYSWTISTRH